MKLHTFVMFAVLATLAAIAPGARAQAPKGTIPPHQATLTWTNPTDPTGTTITGSNAYRCPGTCTATSGTFAVLNSAAISGTSYVDSAVQSNTTYSWCVTNLVTLSTGPFETACSNVVTATIPKDAAGVPALNQPVTQ
jgi:hypothetical protein